MKKIITGVLVLMLMATIVMAAGKSNHLDLVSKDSSNWEVIDGPVGKLNYDTDFVFNGHGLVANNEYTLITYGGWNDIVCLGTETTNNGGNINIRGITPDLKTDDVNIPVKVWLVPSEAADCEGNKMLQWTPDLFVFEE